MESLMELRLGNTHLAVLPDSIGSLSRLRELHLRNNKLISLPDSVSSMKELRQIDLRGNPLQSLPDAIENLPRLESWICAGLRHSPSLPGLLTSKLEAAWSTADRYLSGSPNVMLESAENFL